MITFHGFLQGRIVVKYGTNALAKVDEQGNLLGLDRHRIDDIARFGRTLNDKNIELIVVSSGALVAGMEQKKLAQVPENAQQRQDLATDGQLHLFLAYAEALEKYEMGLRGPLLVTMHNFRTDKERTNILERVERGFEERKIAVFNTNDAVTNDELVPKYAEYRFTDNDPLAAYVAVYCRANSLIMVSEEGKLGSGGGMSKVRALRFAEKHGVKTNLNHRVAHNDLEAAVEGLTHGTNRMARL